MTLALSKDQSCGKFPFLVDFRVGLGFFFRCSMELSDYHLIQDMLGKYREAAECVLIQATCVRHFIQARNQK